MNINYSPVCPACNAENKFPDLKCRSCGAFLRKKVYNIDLWDSLRTILHDPQETFTNIIYAEKKNYVTILPFFIILKLYLNLITVINFSGVPEDNLIPANLNLVYFASYFFLMLFAGTLFLKLADKTSGIKLRFKDAFAVIVYSYTPLLLSLVLITTLAFGLLGSHWFTGNPSPFMFKPVATWVIIGIEVLLKLWSVFLLFYAVFLLIPKRSKAFIIGFILFILFNLHYLLILV